MIYLFLITMKIENIWLFTEKVKSFWWHYKNVTRTKEYNYLRTIDGWGTLNSNQDVDMNSFYSSLGLKSLNLTQRK